MQPPQRQMKNLPCETLCNINCCRSHRVKGETPVLSVERQDRIITGEKQGGWRGSIGEKVRKSERKIMKVRKEENETVGGEGI